MRACRFPGQIGASGAHAAATAGSECPVPRNQVLLTSLHSIRPLVSGLARCYRLSYADTQDARQEAVFWTLAAIRAFELVKYGGGASFSAFLQRVIRCRFKNFVRSVRRRDRREQRRGLLGVAGPDEDGEEAGEALEGASWATEEPPNRLAARESNQRASAAVAQLDRSLQELWHLLALGLELRDAAHYLDISYDQAKRRRQNLFAALRQIRSVPT